ncbi:hypothetical protein DIPPA_13124 [Diplonema papillatum]|nr:hypothetical protein DIPPA_13124 [Diplonema papillatum]
MRSATLLLDFHWVPISSSGIHYIPITVVAVGFIGIILLAFLVCASFISDERS